MNKLRIQGYRAGFTLLEMTVVLAISALLGLAAWKFLPVLRLFGTNTPTLALQDAQSALEGFVLREYRLPCPDTTGNGLENCAGDPIGNLPVRTLGISLPHPLRYGVYRNASALPDKDADLATLKDRYIPTLPPGFGVTKTNGLDFCVALRNAATTPSTNLLAGNVPVAYALADPGINGSYDADNALPGKFSAPNNVKTAAYDDLVVAVGLTELSGRLECPKSFGKVQGAASAAYVAYENERNALMYKKFRDFAYVVRQSNTQLATANVVMTSLDVANATATGITAIAVALATEGASVGTTAGGAVLGILGAAAGLTGAAVQLSSAVSAENTAKNQKNAANTYDTKLLIERGNALSRALDTDKKGLTP